MTSYGHDIFFSQNKQLVTKYSSWMLFKCFQVDLATSPCNTESCMKSLMFFLALQHVLSTNFDSVSLVQTLQSYVVLVDKKLNKLLQSVLGDERMGKEDMKRLCNILKWIKYTVRIMFDSFQLFFSKLAPFSL